jgi:hypothetical protein
MATDYKDLITGVCAKTNCKEPERMLKGDPLNVNGVMITLLYREDAEPDRIFLHAEFGKVPDVYETEILEQLLLENHLSFDGNGPGFGLSPVTGKVIYTHYVSLKATTAQDLASRIVYIVNIAAKWRETYFLDQPRRGTSAPPPGARHPHFIRPKS